MNDYEAMIKIVGGLGGVKVRLEQLQERLKEKDDLIKVLLEKLGTTGEAPTSKESK